MLGAYAGIRIAVRARRCRSCDRETPHLLSQVLPDYGVEVKGAAQSLELDVSAGVEPEVAGILGELLQRRGNQNFATAGLSGDPRGNDHGFPVEIAGLLNRFTRVYSDCNT